MLNSYAARLIAGLNYHDTKTRNCDQDLEEEINNSVYWCFYLDRTLSSLLRRPPSLSELQGSASDLICWNNSLPHMPLIRILVDLAEIQGDLSSSCKASDNRQILDNHSKLQERMNAIYSTLQSVSLDNTEEPFWTCSDTIYVPEPELCTRAIQL